MLQKLTKWMAVVLIAATIIIVGLLVFTRTKGTGLMDIHGDNMVPTMPQGTLVAVDSHSGMNFKVGDIIAYRKPPYHRIVIVRHLVELPNQANAYHYITKGDNNSKPDDPLTASDIVGKVTYKMWYLGSAIDLAHNPFGLLLLVYLPSSIGIMYELSRLASNYRKPQAKRR
jgi:signal peptidase I